MSQFTVQRLNHATRSRVALSTFDNVKDAVRSCRGQNPYEGITYRVVWYRGNEHPTVVYVHSRFGRDWVPQTVCPRGAFLMTVRDLYRFSGVEQYKKTLSLVRPFAAPLPA